MNSIDISHGLIRAFPENFLPLKPLTYIYRLP
jgi:hypothetical protein